MASDQLRRHTDILEAETRLLEQKIAKKNEQKKEINQQSLATRDVKANSGILRC